ncbi:MAG: pentapeptide repeat-containing protein [Methanothrix sp.]|nr:pentapeptide repeat-containing protein [Methanothrix sp.]
MPSRDITYYYHYYLVKREGDATLARLRGRILVLSLIALLFLALAVQAEPSRVVQAEEILNKIELGEPVEYDGVTVVGDLDVSALNLSVIRIKRTSLDAFFRLSEDAKIVASPIKIINSKINGELNLKDIILQNATNFTKTKFEGAVLLRGSRFSQTDFYMAQFNKDADFEGTWFSQSALFREVGFNQTNFAMAHFDGDVYFTSAQFNQNANFVWAWFNQTADFKLTQFNQTVDFRGAHFSQTDFRWAQFNEDAVFEGTLFRQHASFMGAQFKLGYFYKSQFDEDADFTGANFDQSAFFKEAHLFNASFDHSDFSNQAEFEGVQINGTLSLYRTKYDKLNIRWSSIHDLAYDDTAYYLLIENFKKLGFTDDASECYYSYRCKHREELFRQGKIDSWFFDLLAWAAYGYGLRPVRPLGWSVLFILLGGAFFFFTKSISRSKDSEPSGKRLRAIRSKDSQQSVSDVSFWEALLLSATYFTSGASAIISSVPQEFSPLGRSRYVVVILRLLGWVFFVLFLTSLGKIA